MSQLAPGTVIGGKYRLEEPIGSGGMASVWRATHVTLESPLAVKLLETYGSHRDQMARRFLREARLAASLRHRNVVHILDHGMMDDGQPFMVMELLDGVSLGDRLDLEEPPSDLEMLALMEQVLSGLASVHDAGIVHRDVKPDNVFIVRDADGEYPKLLDFGISRDEDPGATGATRMTKTGAVVGTPLYMSPEQARGVRDLDRRTDLWSVGMILYEGFTGICPFESENMGEVLIKVATEPCPPLAELRPDLPPIVSQVVMRALEKDRELRWPDARAMRDAVREAADAVAARSGAVAPVRRYPSLVQGGARATAVEASAAASAARAPSRAPWIALSILSVAIAAVAVTFVAMGGEVRFQSAAAETDDPATAAPPRARRAHAQAPAADTEPSAADEPDATDEETTAPDAPTPGEPDEASADGDESSNLETSADGEASTNREAGEARTDGDATSNREASSNAPAEDDARPSADRTGRDSNRAPRTPAAGDETRSEPSPQGGFLRDLDY